MKTSPAASLTCEMDQKSSQFHSITKDQSRTFLYNSDIENFAHSWQKLDEREISFATLSHSSSKFTIPFHGNREFCGLLEVAGSSDGYFMVNSSIGLLCDRDENSQDGHRGTIDCKRFIEVYIVEDVVGEFCAKGLFQSQFQRGKESIVSVRFMAKDFLAKVAKLSNWHLRIAITIELTTTSSSPWKATRIVYPVKALEAPFLATLRSKAFADVKIECEGQTFEAHKIILSCASTVFARMLGSSMVEASTKTIKIDDIESSTIKLMLDFIYTGNFTALSDDSLIDQLYCAEKYDLEDLKGATLLHMVSNISDLNVIKFLDAAAHCNAPAEILDKFIQHCKTNFESLSTRAEFKDYFTEHFDEFFSADGMPAAQYEIEKADASV